MSKKLVIVESPAKAKTIGKYLGKDFSVKASIGHVKDLPTKSLGVDLEDNFRPTYEIIKGKAKVVQEIRQAAEKAEAVYLATDPDREGEAIAWHIAEEIKKKGKGKEEKGEGRRKKGEGSLPVNRVLFNEITKRSVQEAIAHPQKLDVNLYEAQQARRILDRLVGYQISPLLWDKVQRGLSAGRVQSVTVRLICERETEIENFQSIEYWSVEARLSGSRPPPFVAKLIGKEGKKIEITTGEEAKGLQKIFQTSSFVLKEVLRKERRRFPTPPFITSKLQQEAARKLGFTAKKTMTLAQRLYEGVELGDGEIVGLITYMRTDSTRIAGEALNEVRKFIYERYGKEYLPDQAIIYKTKKAAQDAHEAIRPTSLEFEPEKVAPYLSSDELKLYDLIWKRFIACQMTPALYDQTTFNISAISKERVLSRRYPPAVLASLRSGGGPPAAEPPAPSDFATYDFRATGSVLKFPGFITVYLEGLDESVVSEDEDEEKTLPDLQEGEALKLHEILPEQHFTQPPPRFTEASLVKELEEKGIGRPSTYASILSTIQEKKYVIKEEGKFKPSDLGRLVNNLLTENFPEILNVQFTARMEEELDEVEEGTLKWTQALTDFYGTFEKTLKKAKKHMKDIKRQEIATDFVCEKCGAPMVVKWGRHGEFLACSAYPDCKNTREVTKNSEGEYQLLEQKEIKEVCENCGSPMIIKRGRFGSFLACSNYPACKTTKAISIGVNCPDCTSPLAERRSKRGKIFYGCTAYPKCTFALWDKPLNETCPQCGSKYLLVKFSKKEGEKIKCPKKECEYVRKQSS